MKATIIGRSYFASFLLEPVVVVVVAIVVHISHCCSFVLISVFLLDLSFLLACLSFSLFFSFFRCVPVRVVVRILCCIP